MDAAAANVAAHPAVTSMRKRGIGSQLALDWLAKRFLRELAQDGKRLVSDRAAARLIFLKERRRTSAIGVPDGNFPFPVSE
jgi:hypothetical protein